MPRVARHAVTWQREDGRYALSSGGEIERRLPRGDEAGWQSWLTGVPAFAFSGAAGVLGVRQEARPRGGRYWYAYHTAGGQTRKRYLGATRAVTLARLEEEALALGTPPPPTPAEPAVRDGGGAGMIDPGDAAGALPATKLLPPRPPVALVARERLLDALDAASRGSLTLVVAPAGWGKTTVLAAWAAQHPGRVAWLALEGADDDPARFWDAAIAALRARRPGVGATARALLRSPQPPPLAAVVTALINELPADGAGGPLVLLLDDYQLIADPAIHESVAFLIAHLPAGLRLVIAGRVDPDLPLARLRARGQLAELRAADLGFTREEVGAFLHRSLGAPLADGEAAALAARTEGWAAGLQLAALALRHQGDRAAWLAGLTGGHRYLLDYVEEEILARQPESIRRFLLQSAVLTRLGAAVCAAITGEAASRAILDALERANLFLVPLDERRAWFRLHDLFREALLARAAGEPGLLAGAHGRAARWHADHGDGREAIGHALAAGDYPLAGDLIAREAPGLWLAGEARAVLNWLLALPDDLLPRHARLALDAALRLLEALHETAGAAYAGARLRVEQTLARLEDGLRATTGVTPPDGGEAALLRRRLRLLRALLETRDLLARGDAAGLALLAEEIATLAEREEIRWRMIGLALRFWLHFTIRHEGQFLLPQLLEARREATASGEHLATLRATAWLALIRGRAGHPDLAERECLTGLALAGRLDLRVATTGYLHLGLASIYYDGNRLEAAATALAPTLAVARTWQQTDLLIVAHHQQAYLALARGDLPAADRALREAEAILRRERTTHHASVLAAARARYWLVTGDLASAARWAARVAFDARDWTPEHAAAFLMTVRVSLARGAHAEALAALARLAAQLDRPGDFGTLVAYLAVRLMALHHAGDRAGARAAAARLLALTAPTGRLRDYLDEGPPMERALAALLDAPDDKGSGDPALPRAYIAGLLAAFDEERRSASDPGSTAASAPGSPSSGVPHPPPVLVEPLTRREREVLRLLADGASNQEIAAALSISPFTVKRHVGSLLGKLGATNRTGAVARARDAALL